MKVIGASLIIVSCGFYGLNFYKKCISNIKYTQGLISGFEFIKSEIFFSQLILCEAFLKSKVFAGSANAFFELIGNETSREGVALNKAFEKCSYILKANTNRQVYCITKDAILQLGTSDAECQTKLLESTIDKLKKSLELQNAFCAKEGMMCKKIGFVLGMAVSLLLI
ncbi:MAG: stage III sporulation protein AB [Clostridia bacterium]|nr:stage III sporulation protein AB [Clostridia bacterium]